MSSQLSSGKRRATPSASTGSFVFEYTESEDFPMSSWLRSDSTPASSPLISTASPAFEAQSSFIDNDVVIKSELISSPDFRTSRLPSTVPTTTNTSPKLSLKVAISAHNTSTSKPVCQDVHSIVKTSASSSSAPRSHGQLPSPLETSVSSFSQPSQHGLTSPNQRLRTPSQVFSTSSELAAHYGIPQTLPPAPRTIPRQSPTATTELAVSDFAALRASYLNMLSIKPADNTTMTADGNSTDTPAVPPAEAQTPIIQSEMDFASYLASPEFKDELDDFFQSPSFDMDEYLTSPLPPLMHDFDSSPMETPYNEFLTTPVIASDDTLLSGCSDYSLPLFGGVSDYEPVISNDDAKHALDFDKLYTISPGTPALGTASLHTPQLAPDLSSFPSPAPSTTSNSARRRTNATGTRKGVTPESLVSLDAPTQPRKYVIPSATSRKELPAVFARKRARSQAFGDEEDELAGEDQLGPNATEKEQIEWKRRQNTLAARKSRKRKLQHQQELEDAVKQLKTEREVWKTRALTFQQLLVSHGIPFNEFQD